MELATFKRSVLTQINVIKQCLCVCTYVPLHIESLCYTYTIHHNYTGGSHYLKNKYRMIQLYIIQTWMLHASI